MTYSIMVYLFSDGFESGDFTAWSSTQTLGTADAPLVQNTVKRKGTYGCYLHVPAGGGGGFSIIKKTISAQTILNSRVYILFNTLPQVAGTQFNYLIDFGAYIASLQADVDVDENPIWEWAILSFVTSTWYLSDPFPIAIGVWYGLELEAVVDPVVGLLNLYVDNNKVISQAGLDTGSTPITEVTYRGNSSDPSNEVGLYYDDVVIADKYIGLEQAWFGMTGNMTWK